MQRVANRHLEHGLSHIEHQKQQFTLRNSEPRFAANGVAKLALLRCKTGTFALQNWHFCVAKRTVLECKMHRFGITFALRKVLESTLFAYYQVFRA